MYIIAISVLERTPICFWHTLNLGSLILLLTRAVFILMVSVNPSLEPLITVSEDGSLIPLVGHALDAITKALSDSSIISVLSPDKAAIIASSTVFISLKSDEDIAVNCAASNNLFFISS